MRPAFFILFVFALASCTGSVPSGSQLPGLDGSQLTGVKASSVGTMAAETITAGVNAVSAATDAATASAIVKRDAGGNFSAGTITATLAGNAASATFAAGKRGSDLIAGPAVTLPGDGDFYNVAGSSLTTLSAMPAGSRVTLNIQSTTTLKQSANLQLSGNGDFIARANDIFQFVSLGGGAWRELFRSAAKDSAVFGIITASTPALTLTNGVTELVYDQYVSDNQGEYIPDGAGPVGLRFVPHQDGYYEIQANLVTLARNWVANESCALSVENLTTNDQSTARTFPVGNLPCVVAISATLALHANDSVRLFGSLTSVGAISVDVSAGSSGVNRLRIVRVRPL